MSTGLLHKGYSLVIADRTELTRYLPAIAAAGFDGIEPTFVAGAYPSPENHRGRARELRAVCDDLGLVVPSMRAGLVPWGTIPSDDPAERARALEHTRRALESLAELGGNVLLVVPGERVAGVDYRTHWKRVVEFAQAAGELARDLGMRIGLENVEARFPVSELDWCSLIDEIGSENVGVYLDVGNVVWLGFGYPEQWIRTLGPRIVQVHFKDAVYRLHGATLHAEIRQLLDGEVDWPSVMTALRDVSYAGWISVEPEGYRHFPELLPNQLSGALDAIIKHQSEDDGDE